MEVAIVLGAKKAIQALEETGRVGKVEGKKTVLTYDGNSDGKIPIPGDHGFVLYKVSDEVIDLNTITSLVVTNAEKGVITGSMDVFEQEGAKDNIVIEETDLGVSVKLGGVSVVTCVLSDGNDDLIPYEGTYFLGELNGSDNCMFVSRVEAGSETVHPIDPKYLPEGFGSGGLPVVVDLNNYMLGENTLLTTIFYAFTMGGGVSTPGNALDEAFWQDVANKRPVVFLLDLSAVGMSEKIYISNVNRVFKEDGVAMVDFSCVVKYTDGKFYQMLVGMIRGSESREPTIAMKRTLVDR